MIKSIIKSINSSTFDSFALFCSSFYFILFVAFLGCFTSGTCSDEVIYGIKLAKIILLIPPIIFFSKLAYNSIYINDKYSARRFQLSLLMIYFLFVFIFLCADIENNTIVAKNINIVCLAILPIFIIISFYNSYESWLDKKIPRYLVYLFLTLSFLYYCLFYFSLKYNGSVFGEFGDKSIDSVLIAIGVLLIFQFAYAATKVGKN
jgi:hypothetical protein